MNTALPSLFISHGAPTIVLSGTPAANFLREVGARLPRPRAILVISAHWMTREPTISLAAQPEMIYDFGGFPDALYQMRYPAPGAPALGERIAALLQAANIPCQADPARGYDHGVWTPLKLMYPAADIPVAQLSHLPHADAALHYRIGQALQPLRAEGVLIIASGTAVHNLRALGREGETPDWAVQFDQWTYDAVLRGDAATLLEWDAQPTARMAHPTPDHWLPLYVALGAAVNAQGQFRGACLHRSWEFGSLSMAGYSFTSMND